ncbi:MAG: glutamyl-tRNA(Gln) amidotransferase subunit A [marine bacterium B5-7]|nr:MAG: glutamyl-tRNA(Gln) amidotransferase subunit A [marine bacterium B5-7]
MKQTAAELAKALAAGETTSEKITESYLDRIARIDPNFNSFITVCNDQAMQAARESDERRQNGSPRSALDGVPIAQKDLFCTQGIKTSCGSRMLDSFVSPYNATLIDKCNAAGLIMLGKTNMDEFAMGSSNENSYYGHVRNPWDTDRVPGGSSGGSAAAVAARLAPWATGTDTGGSIRQPAAFCGLTGLKPSYGLVSRYGMVAFASSLDQGGPMAQTAEDAALLLNVIAGFDEKDSTSIEHDVPDYTATLNNDLSGLTAGLPEEYFTGDLDPAMAEVIEQSKKVLAEQGVSFKPISLPRAHLAAPAYYVIAPAECSSNLARLDGVRYGYRCDNPKDLLDMYCRSRGEAFGDEVKRRVMVGAYALSAGFYDAYYVKAQQIRRLMKNDFDKAFEQVDFILSPTTPSPAFKLGEKTGDPITMYLNDVFTIAVNLAGLPALSMPAGFVDDLPVGVQLIGQYFDEARLLNVAHRYQQKTEWHRAMPDVCK